MYGGKKRRFLLCRRRRRHSRTLRPPHVLNTDRAASVVYLCDSHRRQSGHDVGRCAWPRAAGPPVVIPAPGERGTTPPAAATAPTTQLPRRCGERVSTPRRFEDKWTKVGRQVLVVVRIVPIIGGGGWMQPRGPGGRAQTGGRRGHDHLQQRRILERFAHVAFQAVKVRRRRPRHPYIIIIFIIAVICRFVFKCYIYY